MSTEVTQRSSSCSGVYKFHVPSLKSATAQEADHSFVPVRPGMALVSLSRLLQMFQLQLSSTKCCRAAMASRGQHAPAVCPQLWLMTAAPCCPFSAPALAGLVQDLSQTAVE